MLRFIMLGVIVSALPWSGEPSVVATGDNRQAQNKPTPRLATDPKTPPTPTSAQKRRPARTKLFPGAWGIRIGAPCGALLTREGAQPSYYHPRPGTYYRPRRGKKTLSSVKLPFPSSGAPGHLDVRCDGAKIGEFSWDIFYLQADGQAAEAYLDPIEARFVAMARDLERQLGPPTRSYGPKRYFDGTDFSDAAIAWVYADYVLELGLSELKGQMFATLWLTDRAVHRGAR